MTPLRKPVILVASPLLLAFLLFNSICPAQEGPRKKVAFLVGVGKYKNHGTLAGIGTDVSSFKKFITEQWKFTDVSVLRDEQATAAGIEDGFFNQLTKKCGQDDTALFYFSGHGTQLNDDSNDERDGLDEAIVPYDYDVNLPSTYLRDDKILAMITELSKSCKNIVVIFDTCHSGDATLAIGDGTFERKQIRLETKSSASGKSESDVDFDIVKYPENHILLAACKPSEESLVSALLPGGAPRCSVFTWYLQTLGQKTTTLDEGFLSQLSKSVHDFTTNTHKHIQTPAAYGKISILNSLVRD
jgi:hypothetical protein